MPGLLLSQSSDSNSSLIKLLLKLWYHLSPSRHSQLGVLMILMLANSAAEVLSLAALLPFLTLLANPEGLWNKPLVQQWAPRVGISNADSLILPFTVMFIFTVLVAGVVRLLNLWLNGRLASAIGSDLSCEAYRRTLYQPYANHLASNSSDLIASISTDTPIVINQIINPLLLSLSSGLTAVSIVITLIMIKIGRAHV